jgi:hypothetical protein
MTVSAPPTSDIGRPDLSWGTWGQGLLSDWWETAADLIWPQSVITYGRMRHDPKLRAVLQALTLPILRATWALDPAGCRPEVVALVSEDLGLAVRGKDPVSTGARRRGVIWSRHLREALFSLIYGHMPFERRYDVSSGQARLVNLGARMPWTIAQINLDDSSQVRDIVQTTQRDPIPGNRLAWYSYGQEGANWAGISVLRPAFGAWLLKHEMWRVLATSNRRFGMGVPVVEAPPGATREMVAEAQALASAMRVGDQTGVGLPQGFVYHLEGLTGSVPDSLEFIRYLDQQMAGMALAGVLELGTTETGSRALGESFLDLFLLALQALADEIALTATSGQPGMPGIVVDLVDQNWGPEEPAPQVVCLDVGESYSITAEALGILSQFGLLGPDASIDDWIRKKWGLPARTGPWRPTSRGIPAPGQPGGAFLPSGATPTPEADESGLADNVPPQDRVPSWTPPVPAPAVPPPAPAGGGTGPPGPQPPGGPVAGGKLRASGPRRKLSDVEAASGWSPEQQQADFRSRLDGLLASWGPVHRAQRDSIVDQVDAAVSAGRPDRLAALSVDSSDGAALLETALTAMAGQGADRMREEAASQGVDIPAVTVDGARLKATAQARAALAAAYVCQAAGNKALQVTAAAEGDAGQIIDVFIDGLSQVSLRDQLAAALTAAQNQGRVAVLKAAPASAGTAVYRSSEFLDENACGPCVAEDGTVFASLADAEAAYPNGGFLGCEGGLRCRGTVIANWGGVTRVS